MRLQLTILRHGLPPVQVLWTLASAVRAPLLAAGNSITISQFLEQVNEILPLESEDWGLEDYSVEVRGFECLHFSELNHVLKEDDEVCIRPLQTQDLRYRKISGRHQIAADGKHLIDGVAFGRPFLRRADRPAIKIPPRKRRRITYDEEEDFVTNELNNDRQVIVRADRDTADDFTAGDESDDDEDFAPDDEEEDDLGAELGDLQNGLDDFANTHDGKNQDDMQSQRTTRSQRSPKGLGLLQLLDDDGRPFAGQYNNPLLDLYGQDDTPNRHSEIRVRKRGTTDLTQNSSENIKSILRDSSASPQRVSRRDSAGSNRSVRFENAEPTTPATIREREDSEDMNDGDFEPGKMDESDKENSQPQDQETEASDSFFEGSQSSSCTSSDDQLSEDETSSSGSSSSSSSSDSEPEQQPIKHIAHKSETSDTSETSSGSSSSSTSDSEPEPPKTGQKRKRVVRNVKSKINPNEAPLIVTASAPTTTPPGSGSRLTRSRNKRRRESRKLSYIKNKGILPAAATKSDLRKFEDETTLSERQEMIATGGVRAAFEAKRQDLLNSITAGGVDVSLDHSLREKDSKMFEDQSLVGDLLSKAVASRDNIMIDQPASNEGSRKHWREEASAKDLTNTSAIVPELDTAPPLKAIESLANDSQSTAGAIETSKSITTPAPESQHRRSRLDVSGAKRMLFGSLGLKTPKTKEDEIKTREKLIKNVRPIKAPHVHQNIEIVEDVGAAAEDESWKDKIDLRAVECCHEGVELSTPPFPFVQRWDPQQQRGYSMGNAKKRKGKKRKRNKNEYYEDNSFNPQNKIVRLDKDDYYGQEAEPETAIEKANVESNGPENSQDDRFEDSVRANEQLLHETEDASAATLVEVEEKYDLTNDLPTLPEDISICSSFTLDKVTKGQIVAFKQLEMSIETNWQPKISGYRTAIVDEILDDGMLSMTLAKRDQPSKNIQYDNTTGKRLYSKFEMPGYHEENGEDTNGNFEIAFDELINPVVVETASGKGNQDVILQGQDHVVAHVDTNDQAANQARDTDAGLQGDGLDGPLQQVSKNAADESSEGARQEISELIRDAGWRSSIDHALTKQQDDGPPGQSIDLNGPALMGPSSPRFHGFSSSPITNGFQVESSPPPAAFQTSRHVHASGSEIAESVSPQRRDDSPARSNISDHKSAVDYPNLPQIIDDGETFQQEAQDRSGLLEADHQIASQDLTSSSSVRRSPFPSIASPNQTSPEKSSQKPVSTFDGTDSDSSLPELFSQAFEKRMSQLRDIKSEPSEGDSISPPSHRESKKNRIDSSQRESNRDWEPDYSESEHEDEGGSTPRQSQPVFSSQIVDLTISSDTVDPIDDSYVDDGDDDDSYVLPKGPGWVQKPRISESRDGPTKKTRGSMRSR